MPAKKVIAEFKGEQSENRDDNQSEFVLFSCSCKTIDLSVKSITVTPTCNLMDAHVLTYVQSTNTNMSTHLSMHA